MSIWVCKLILYGFIIRLQLLLATLCTNDAIPSTYNHAHFQNVFSCFPTSAACCTLFLYPFKKERAQRRWTGFGFLVVCFWSQPLRYRRYQTTLMRFQSIPYHALKRQWLTFSLLIFFLCNAVPSSKKSKGEKSLMIFNFYSWPQKAFGGIDCVQIKWKEIKIRRSE